MMQMAHTHEKKPVKLSGSSSERRQRRVLALVEHMAIIDQLISIFEQGGGTCELQNGCTKVFPWTTLPVQLATKQLYFTGWPECCLPRASGIHRNAVDPASDPMWWSAEQRAAMRAQLDARQIMLCSRQSSPGETPFIFEYVDIHGAVKRTMVGLSTKWYHRMARSGSGSMLSASTSPVDEELGQHEFIPSTSFLDTYFHSLGPNDASTPGSSDSTSLPMLKQEDEMMSTMTTTRRSLPQHLESRLRRLLEGIPNKVLPGKRRRSISSHSRYAHSDRDGSTQGEKENAVRDWARTAAHSRLLDSEASRPAKKRRGDHPDSSSLSSLEEINTNYPPALYHMHPDAHSPARGRTLIRSKPTTQPSIAVSYLPMHSSQSLPHPESRPSTAFSLPTPTTLSPTSQPTSSRAKHQHHKRFNSATSPVGYIPPRDHGVDVLPISPFSPALSHTPFSPSAHSHTPFSPSPSQGPFTPVLSHSPVTTFPVPQPASFAALLPEDASR